MCAKLLGECYNYCLLDSQVVFRTLYLYISDSSGPLASPSEYFGIRLACHLLDTCGQYFDKGAAKRRLDRYLVFFQKAILAKAQPLPMVLACPPPVCV